MSRLALYQEARRTRKKLALIIMLFFLLLLVGICAVDYSGNRLMNNQKGLNIVALEYKTGYMEIWVMNGRIYLDTQKIEQDIHKLKAVVAKWIS